MKSYTKKLKWPFPPLKELYKKNKSHYLTSMGVIQNNSLAGIILYNSAIDFPESPPKELYKKIKILEINYFV